VLFRNLASGTLLRLRVVTSPTWGKQTVRVNCIRLAMAAAIVGWISWGSTARADWASCQSTPTRSCLLDEALRSGDGQLTGKERLDVMALTGYRNHPEYLAPADIEEAKQQVMGRQASSPALRWQYFSLATTGLVAADRIQEAYDLMSELDAGWVNSALDEVIRALIKADKLDEIPVFGRPVLADPRHVFNTAVKTLADQGNIEQALVLTALHPTGLPDEDTLTWLGVAYAKRGDGKTAARFYARAQANIEGKKVYSVTDDTAIELRFKQIVLQAVRGDIDGVRTALKDCPRCRAGPIEPR
jgi:hypothetical protein